MTASSISDDDSKDCLVQGSQTGDLLSHTATSDNEDNSSDNDGDSSDVTDLPQDIGRYIVGLQQPLKAYQALPRREHHNYPESFKLFRCLYKLWSTTGQTVVPFTYLGALLRAEDALIFCRTSKPQITTFINKAMERQFPMNWVHCIDNAIDLQPLVTQVTAVQTPPRFSPTVHLYAPRSNLSSPSTPTTACCVGRPLDTARRSSGSGRNAS